MRVASVRRATFRNGQGNRSYVVTCDVPLWEHRDTPSFAGLQLIRAFHGMDFHFDLSQRLGPVAMQVYGPTNQPVLTPDFVNGLLDSLATPAARLTDGPLGVVYIEISVSITRETVKKLWHVPGVSRVDFITQESLAMLLTGDVVRSLYPKGPDNKFLCARLDVDADIQQTKNEIGKTLASC